MVKWGKWCSLTVSWGGCCIVSKLMEYASVSQKTLWNEFHNRIWFQELKFHLKKGSLQTESSLLLPLCIVKAHPGIMKHLSVYMFGASEKRLTFPLSTGPVTMCCISKLLWQHERSAERELSPPQRCSGTNAAWVKGVGGGVRWTQILLLKYKAGKLLAMIPRWLQRVGILSQRQSWIPTHVDESFRLPHCWSLFSRKVSFNFKSNFLQLFWLHHFQTLKYHKTPQSTCLQLTTDLNFSKC